MTRQFFIFSLFFITACSDGSFVERQGKGQNEPTSEHETEPLESVNFDPEGSQPHGGDAPDGFDPEREHERQLSPDEQVLLDETAQACLDAVDGIDNGVIEVSEGEFDLSSIPDGSTLLIRATQWTVFRLRSDEPIFLQGLCVYNSGQTNMSLELRAEVENAVYIVRGQANTKLDFSGGGSLRRLGVDTDGPSNLTLIGEQVACDQLSYRAEGPNQIICNHSVIP